jgi:REP element-mobilizing transposase RayT
VSFELEQLDFGFQTPKKPAKKRPPKKPRRGRPPILGRRVSEGHRVRAALPAKTPVHVTMRVKKSVGRLRQRKVYQAVRKATLHVLRAGALRIVHLSIQQDHLHAIVEASDRDSLARGIQGFQISAARHINRAIGHRGGVFADRYHADPLRTPRMVRNAIAYAVNNWRKHGEDRGSALSIDPVSSAISFTHWRVPPKVIPLDEPLAVSPPRFWLLSTGWTRHGLIDPYEVPGPKLQRMQRQR